MLKSLIAILALVLLAPVAHGLALTYGAEFEVTSNDLGFYDFTKKHPSKSPEKQAQLKLVEHIRQKCLVAGCTVTSVRGKFDEDFRVQFEDGWFFTVSYDPACVEITFKPSTLDELETKKALINEQIFGTARAAGMYVMSGGSSHVNIGIRSAFGDDGKKFLRFFVDYANHADLALGSLGYDPNNAPPLSILTAAQRKALQKIISKVEQGKLKTVAEVAAAIEREVYTSSKNPAFGSPYHYQAIGLKSVNRSDLTKTDAPMELRAVWVQESAEKFILVARLIEARIETLNASDVPIIYGATDRTIFTESELRSRFEMYVLESGLRPGDYASLLPRKVAAAHLDPFVDSTANMNDRIERIGSYWDLVATSPLARAKFVEILESPAAANHSLAKLYRARLQEALSPRVVTKSEKIRGFVGQMFGRRTNAEFAFPADVAQALLRSLDHREDEFHLPRSCSLAM